MDMQAMGSEFALHARKAWPALLLLVSSCAWSFDIEEATSAPSPAAEEAPAPQKEKYRYTSKEEFLADIASGETKNMLFDQRMTWSDEQNVKEFTPSIMAILHNSYGLDSTVSSLRTACPKTYVSINGTFVVENLKVLAESVNYDKKYSPDEKYGVNLNWNLKDFSAEDPQAKHKQENFKEHFGYMTAACAGNEQGDAFLTAYKAFLQDAGAAMEAYVAPRREAFNRSVLALKEQQTKLDGQKAAQDQCKQSREYQLYFTSRTLEARHQAIASYRKLLSRQDDIAKESGVVNLEEKYRLGKLINNEQVGIKSDFADYKRLGGMAASADAVKAPQDPCSTRR